MVMSFVRRSLPKEESADGYDIGLLGVPSGDAQVATHARSVTCFLMALLSQCLDNYADLKRLKPELEDADLEALLDGLDDRRRFLSGMARVRIAVFHVKDMKAWRHRDIEFVAQVCAGQGGIHVIVEKLLNHLYGFTSKCFRGELHIHPRFVYERAADQGIPEMNAKLEAGDISVQEYERAFEKLLEEMMPPGDQGHGREETNHGSPVGRPPLR